MAGLPLSLVIGIWFVGAMWAVGLVAYFLEMSSDMLWFVLILGSGIAGAEWRAIRNHEE